MRYEIKLLSGFILIFLWCFTSLSFANTISVPVLTYHNFHPSTPGSMTVSTAKFEAQLKWLKDNGYTVIPLAQLVEYLQGKVNALPPKSVVITADDGRETVYQYMLPLVRKYNIPVTLFIYPISISHASYALTWEQLKKLQKTGLFDIQGHTYWHPDFKYEKKHNSVKDYEKLVHVQLFNSKKILEDKLGIKVTLLAWPYGIYDAYLEQEAAKAGYTVAFDSDDGRASRSYKLLAQPRYTISENDSMQRFAAMVGGSMGNKIEN